jgi:nitrogen regulatory protein P-II 1
MYKLEAIVRPERLDEVKNALTEAGYNGMNIQHVTGRGIQRGIVHQGRGGESYTVDMLPKVKIEVVVSDDDAEKAVQLIAEAARTNNIGDGKIFLIPVADAIRVRTGERGDAAL